MSKLRVNSQGQRSKVVSQRSEVKSQRWMVKSRSWKYHRVLLANSSKHSTDNFLLDSDDFRTGNRNVSHCHWQQFFEGKLLSGRSEITIGYYSWVQTIYGVNARTDILQSSWKRVAPSRSAFWLSTKGAFQAYVPPYKHFALLRVMMRFFAPDKGIFTFQIGTILTLSLI